MPHVSFQNLIRKFLTLAILSVRLWFWERSCLQTFCSMGTGNPSSFPMAMAQPFGWGPRSWGARWHLTTISNLSWVCLSLNVMIQPSRLYSCFLNLFCKWHDFTRISSILLCSVSSSPTLLLFWPARNPQSSLTLKPFQNRENPWLLVSAKRNF